MKWISSTPGAQIPLETGIYVGSDRSVVEAGKLELAKRVKIREFEKSDLKVGESYFWRVDQLDGQGRVIAPGLVLSTAAESELEENAAYFQSQKPETGCRSPRSSWRIGIRSRSSN